METTVFAMTQYEPSLNTATYITTTVIGDNASNNGVLIMMNNFTTPTEDQPSTAFFAFYFLMRFLFCSFAIFGNTLTIAAVIRFEKLRNNANFLICSLAAADVIGCITFPFNLAHEILSDEPIFVPLCFIHRIMGMISISMNIYSIFGIAIDRYLYIGFPLKYPVWVKSIRIYTIIAITWLYQVTVTIVLFTSNHHLTIGVACKNFYMLSRLADGILFIPLGVCIVLTVPFYVAIGRIAYKQGKAIADLNQPYDTYEAAANRQQKKIAKMMGTVLGIYFACFMPQLMGLFVIRSVSTNFWLHYEKIAALFYWLNIWLNPVIYAWKGEDFRVAFRKLLGLKPDNSAHPANQG